MKLTLYENCFLNKSYSEVFRTRSLVDSYLSTLQYTEYDITNVYIKTQDKLILTLTSLVDLMKYNYLTLKGGNYDEVTKTYSINIYAFIDKIDIKNSVAEIYYTTDVWTTYQGMWTFRDGLLTNCLRVEEYADDIHEKELPLDYVSNGAPIYRQLSNTSIITNENKFVNLIVTLQRYKLNNTDEITSSYIASYLVCYIDNREETKVLPWDFIDDTIFTTEGDRNISIYTFIARLTKAQIDGTLTGDDYLESNEIYGEQLNKFNILDIYAIPSISVSGLNLNYNDGYVEEQGKQITPLVLNIPSSGSAINHSYSLAVVDNSILLNKTLINDYKRIGIGFYSDIYNTINNGINTDISLYLKIFNGSPSFYLEMGNGVYDVTEDFRIETTLRGITNDTFEQRRIAVNLQKTKSELNIIKGGIKVADSAIKGGMSGGIAGAIAGGTISLIKNAPMIFENIAEINAITAEKYSNFYANNMEQKALLNIKYGLIEKLIDENNSNKEEVEKALAEVGYKVNAIINNLKESIASSSEYDIIKFSFIRITGCTEEINETIKTILTNGAKIWYKDFSQNV